ncbi:hypothetical protein JAAARDRAFT_663984 [Jaapia argillacea MUCL 33604]|uniref:Transcription activator GCR1-like domain-containing protein n=1 Tax=Jaapia argillacea MUCL 33604 TaxID=933084 RepID=A0A067P2N3_9AGAM|nr:hypothetical protein JAAARDRAFT_663984 [Jaapia argillacea MUCL 33604]
MPIIPAALPITAPWVPQQLPLFQPFTPPLTGTTNMVSFPPTSPTSVYNISGPSATINFHNPPAQESVRPAEAPSHSPGSLPPSAPLSGVQVLSPSNHQSTSVVGDTHQEVVDNPEAKWKKLATRFNAAQLLNHEWEWINGDWLPKYKYIPVTTITEIWTEYADGLRGYLPVRDLNAIWEARWRRNEKPLKTENSRRAKVYKLVQALSEKPRWNIAKALRFLAEKYEPHYRARAFCDYLTPTTHQLILEDSKLFK